jgi:hypothetical protein
MSVYYECQRCKEQAEQEIPGRRPPHWSTVNVYGPHTRSREYHLCNPCNAELAGFMDVLNEYLASEQEAASR